MQRNSDDKMTQDADAGGRWRFARFDGRFVFDYDDGRKGFRSSKFFDTDSFAEYVNTLEVALREAEATHTSWQNALRTAQQMLEEAEQERDQWKQRVEDWYDKLTWPQKHLLAALSQAMQAEARAAAAETARREAEQECDRLRDELWEFKRTSPVWFSLAQYQGVEARAAAAEAELHTAQINLDLMRPVVDKAMREDVFHRLEVAEAKAALADRFRNLSNYRRTEKNGFPPLIHHGVATQHAERADDPCEMCAVIADYDALTPTHESEAT